MTSETPAEAIGGASSPANEVRLSSVARSAALLTGGAAATQLVGALRELFLAANVGASPNLDALLIALFLPSTLAGVLTAGIVRALVPAYVETSLHDGHEAARRLAGALMTWAAGAGIVLWILLSVFAGLVVTVAGPGLSDAGRTQAGDYLRVLAPVALLATLTAILATVSQAEERFAPIAFGGLVGTTTVVVVMIAFWDRLGLDGIVVGTLIGSVLNLGILAVSAARGSFLPIPALGRGQHFGAIARHAAPLTLSAAILQINFIGDRAITSLIGPGAVSLLRYADVLVRVPMGAISPAWGSAIFPAIVRSGLDRAGTALAATTDRALHVVIALTVPIAVLSAAVAPLAVQIAYGRGAFTPGDSAIAAGGVAAFSPLMVVLMIGPILTSAHNARRRGVLLLVGGTLNVIINISLDLILGRWLGVPGIALASSVAESTVYALFLVRLTRGGDAFPIPALARDAVLALVASLPVAIPVAVLTWGDHMPSELAQSVAMLVAIGIVGLAGYVVVAGRLGLREPRMVVDAGTSAIRARLSPGRSA